MSTVLTLTNRMQAFVADARAKAEGGYTIIELGQLGYNFAGMVVTEAQALQLAGVDKKSLALEAAGLVFDAIADAIPMVPFVPRSWVIPRLRKIVLWLMDGAIEAAYAQLKRQVAPITP